MPEVSTILVDYRCAACGRTSERRVDAPAPSAVPCEACEGEARRRFGFRVGPARGVTGPGDRGAAAGHDHHDGLGTCGLIPTAARALTARLRGDERALEREFRAQERMVGEGTLDPAGGVHGLARPAVPAPPRPAATG